MRAVEWALASGKSSLKICRGFLIYYLVSFQYNLLPGIPEKRWECIATGAQQFPLRKIFKEENTT